LLSAAVFARTQRIFRSSEGKVAFLQQGVKWLRRLLVLKTALSYVAVRLKNRWLLILMSVFIFLVRVNRLGHVRMEIQLAVTLLIPMILWPKTKYDHWKA
jgi:hypothetical protein